LWLGRKAQRTNSTGEFRNSQASRRQVATESKRSGG